MNTEFNAPRKSLGQNFLQDPNIIRKIVAAVNPQKEEPVLEIGPGRGALTELLIESGCQLSIIEFDRDLAAYWRDRAANITNLTVYEGDVLNFDLDTLPLTQDSKLKVVGNLPYNISSPILLHLLQFKARLHQITIMLQKEVIDRLAAHPNTKDYGRLSVVIQQAFNVQALFNVPNTAFFPPPKVTSAVAQLAPYSHYPVTDTERFADIVKHAFAQRRKTLRNNFKRTDYLPLLDACGIDETRRAETLSVAEFVTLANKPAIEE